jgi:hypothetical protein
MAEKAGGHGQDAVLRDASCALQTKIVPSQAMGQWGKLRLRLPVARKASPSNRFQKLMIWPFDAAMQCRCYESKKNSDGKAQVF